MTKTRTEAPDVKKHPGKGDLINMPANTQLTGKRCHINYDTDSPDGSTEVGTIVSLTTIGKIVFLKLEAVPSRHQYHKYKYIRADRITRIMVDLIDPNAAETPESDPDLMSCKTPAAKVLNLA